MTLTQLQRIADQFKDVMDSPHSDVLKMADLHALRDELASYEGEQRTDQEELSDAG